ncbi:MAG: CBS domain-containing protein [Oricola sp.]|jgi:CBS domain-containing protein|nr:CBS domain-containing protein [Oricola sp.]
MKTRDVMTPECRYCAPGDTLASAAQLMASEDFGAVPVAENDQLVGVLTDRDIVVRGVAGGRDVATAKVSEIMSDRVYYCFDDQDVEEVAANMGQMQVRRLPVVNREKQLVGIVSLGDLATQTRRAETTGEALSGISQPAA